MNKFIKGKLADFQKSHKGYITGTFFGEGSLQNDTQVEINYAVLPDDFTAPPHYHSRTKTWVIVLKGAMHFKIEDKNFTVSSGEFLIFDIGAREEVISVDPGTESMTIHAPSIKGGDKISVQ